jgi:hypothetical protein
MKTLALGVFMSGLTISCFCQVAHEPNTFFKESIGLANDQIAEIGQGKAVTKVLNTKTSSEVVVFGAVYINGSIESYLKAAQNLNSLRGSPNYLGLRQLSTPPKLEDFQGFVLEEEDVKDLKNCKPGKCELQLPAASMEDFQKQVNWSAPDTAAQVNALAQKMALQFVLNYQKDGDAALGNYYDKDQPVYVTQQFEGLLGQSSAMSRYLPDLKQYLTGYPQAQLANAESIFYWERVKFGLKPTLRINQMIVYHGNGPSGPIASVAIKQLYASHYFETALDLSVCAKDSGQPDNKGFYLITVKGSRQAGLTGVKGSIIRSKAVSRSKSSLEGSLMHIKKVLEGGPDASAR